MGRAQEDSNRRLLRARDAMDRSYAEPLDIGRLARIARVITRAGAAVGRVTRSA